MGCCGDEGRGTNENSLCPWKTVRPCVEMVDTGVLGVAPGKVKIEDQYLGKDWAGRILRGRPEDALEHPAPPTL